MLHQNWTIMPLKKIYIYISNTNFSTTTNFAFLGESPVGALGSILKWTESTLPRESNWEEKTWNPTEMEKKGKEKSK